MAYRDPDRQREYGRRWRTARRAEWLAKEPCRRCGRLETGRRIFRLPGAPKPSWSRRGPSHTRLTVLCPGCVRQGREEMRTVKRQRTRRRKPAGERAARKPRPHADEFEVRAGAGPGVESHGRTFEETAARSQAAARPTHAQTELVRENARDTADVAPCPVHGRTRAVRMESGALAYRCCGRAVD